MAVKNGFSTTASEVLDTTLMPGGKGPFLDLLRNFSDGGGKTHWLFNFSIKWLCIGDS